MLSLYKLEIFAAVVQEGSFSAAAKRLFITQPAVSQHIQDLETVLGTTLINRHRRGAVLTEAGRTLYDYTSKILELVAQAEAAVTDVERLASGQITIGATPGISSYLLPEWVSKFRQRFPNLAISLQTNITTDIANGVTNNSLNLGFVEGELDGVATQHLGRLILREIVLLVVLHPNHPLAQRASILPESLNNQPLLTRQPHSRTRVWIDSLLARYQIKPQIVGEYDNLEAIKQSVLANTGITILPDYSIEREVSMGLLKALPLDGVALSREITLLWDKRHPFTPVARAMLNHLQEQFPNIRTIL